MKITAEGEGVYLQKEGSSELLKEIDVESGENWAWVIEGSEWGESNLDNFPAWRNRGEGEGLKLVES